MSSSIRSSFFKLATRQATSSGLLAPSSAYRATVAIPFTKHAFTGCRSFSTEAAGHTSVRFSGQTTNEGQSNQQQQEETVKSVDDFRAPNIFTNGVPFFAETGMAMFRIMPAMFKKTEKGNFAADNSGTLFLTFYPRSETELNKFDTLKGVKFGIRAVDIGSILEIDAKKVNKEITIQGSSGHLQVMPGDSEETLRLRGIPKKRFENTPEFVEVLISTGQFKTLQTVLTHAAPTLFGWQVLADPRLVANFMDPRAIMMEENQPAKAAKSFFDV